MEEKRFRINFYSFFIAFFIGIFYVYINAPQKRMIIKYPTPYNSDKLVYRGQTGDCYKFHAEEVNCSKNSVEQPII